VPRLSTLIRARYRQYTRAHADLASMRICVHLPWSIQSFCFVCVPCILNRLTEHRPTIPRLLFLCFFPPPSLVPFSPKLRHCFSSLPACILFINGNAWSTGNLKGYFLSLKTRESSHGYAAEFISSAMPQSAAVCLRVSNARKIINLSVSLN